VLKTTDSGRNGSAPEEFLFPPQERLYQRDSLVAESEGANLGVRCRSVFRQSGRVDGYSLASARGNAARQSERTQRIEEAYWVLLMAIGA